MRLSNSRMNQEHGGTTGNNSSAILKKRKHEIQSKCPEDHIYKHWTKRTQTKLQLKQHKWTISISASSAREIYGALPSPTVMMKNYERRKAESERKRGRERRAVCLTDGYCTVSSMPKRDENLYHRADSEGWLVSSWRWTFGQQTHAVTFQSYTEGARRMKSWKLLQLITLQLCMSRKCMYNTPATHWAELLYPVVSPAVGYYFGDLIEKETPLK